MDTILQIFNQLHIDSLDYPFALLLLIAIPVYGVVIALHPEFLSRYIRFSTFGKRSPVTTDDLKCRIDISKGLHSPRRVFEILCTVAYIACFAFLTIALARPYGHTATTPSQSGIDIYFAVDLSASMKAYDFTLDEMRKRYDKNQYTPNRFEVARSTMLDFIESRARQCYNRHYAAARCDRIGVVVFAQRAFISSPLTTHYSSLTEQLKKRQIDDINASQSAIGDGILKAVASLRHSASKSKSIILITDGDRKGGSISVAQAIAAAKIYDVKVFPILIGKSNRAVLAYTDIGGTVSFHEADFPVNFDALKQIAQKTGGKAFRAMDGAQIKTQLADILNDLEPSAYAEEKFDNQVDISLHYVLLALIFGLFAFIVTVALVRRNP